MVIWLGLSRAGRLFPRPCAAGDLTYAGGRRMCRALPGFFAPQEHSVSKLPECPSGTKNARLCSRAHPACCVCDPVGIRTQDPQLRRLLLYPAELPDPESFGWARTPCCTLLGTERRLFPECGCKDRKIFTFPNFFHNFCKKR